MQFVFVRMNYWTVWKKQYACTCYYGKSAGFWKCWILLVKCWFFTHCTTRRRDVWIPKNCLMMQTICPPRDQMAARGGHWQLPRGHIENLTCGSCFAHCMESANRPCFLTTFMTTYIHTALTFRKLPGHFQSNHFETETKHWGCRFSCFMWRS